MQYTQFGKYLLLDRIAVGGMAEVHRAKSFGVEGFEKILAIKKILPHVAEDGEFVEMFINEAKIASQLTHSNIAQIYDLGNIEGNLFIAMEYVWGKDLLQMVNYFRRRREAMPPPMAVYIATRVCEGIDYAYHKRGPHGKPLKIIHRDVSPQNILISYDGEVKIIDFGIAKATLHHSETQAGLLKGKFSYMSPEQVQGFPIDHRSDIFAIGTCLFEMLTSQSLFRGDNDFITLERVRKAEVPNPTDLNPKIPKSLEKIALKALALDPNDRWQRAADFQDALQRFLITSPPIYTAKRLADWMRLTFAQDMDVDKSRMEEFSKLGPEVLRRSIPPSKPPAAPARGKEMKKTMMGMPAVAPVPPVQPPAIPPGAVARPIAEVGRPETTHPGTPPGPHPGPHAAPPPPPSATQQVAAAPPPPQAAAAAAPPGPPPPPGSPRRMSQPPPPVHPARTSQPPMAAGANPMGATLMAPGGLPPIPGDRTPITGRPPGGPGVATASGEPAKIMAIPKAAGSGVTTASVKGGGIELDYEEDEEPTQALDREAGELSSLLGGAAIPDEPVYSEKPVARRQAAPMQQMAAAQPMRMSYQPGTVIGPDGQPMAMPMPMPMPMQRKAGFNPIWVLVAVISFVVLGVGGVVVVKLLGTGGGGQQEEEAGVLGPDQAALDLRVVPSSAKVSINGKEVPEDKMGFPITIPVNTAVDVEVWKEGYKREVFQILAGPREKIRKELALAELRGRVMVNSVPEKGQVYMDGVLKGETPITLDDFPMDKKVNVSVKFDGKETWAEVVELQEDKPERTLVAILQDVGKGTKLVAKAEPPPTPAPVPAPTPPTKGTTTAAEPTKATTEKVVKTKPAEGTKATKEKVVKEKVVKEPAAAGTGNQGGLIASTTPWARVYVDGKDTGRNTPIVPTKPIMLPPGKHTVTFKILATNQTFDFPVTIKAGENSKLIKKLE